MIKKVNRFDTKSGQRVESKYYVTKLQDNLSVSTVKWLDDNTPTFCSYIKHAERGKKTEEQLLHLQYL